MNRLLLITPLILAFSIFVSAQTVFPGLSADTKRQLATAKRTTPIVLPTWLPAGFKLVKIEMNLARNVPVYDRFLKIAYERELSSGLTQRFLLEAGFDGLGGLPYDATKSLKTQIGTIDLMYEPNDEDGKKIKNYAITEWFNVGRTAYHYVETYEDEPERTGRRMLSMADTEKILRSLRRF